MMRLTSLLRTASPRTVLSGLLVLLLMLVWQLSPGLRFSRAGNGAERVTTVLRSLLPPDAGKTPQILQAARNANGDDGADSDPLPALPPRSASLLLLPGEAPRTAALPAAALPPPALLRPAARAPPLLQTI